ncbi:ScbA/BarX family gamma-butyrolactone biosynthesis protein [Streptomyces sp. DSM 116496]|uniref:ScbA/BarX family gamma-butyrolactone biosynthesis protein n=1 Tax=Streptomyces stoeckheimensis TaxID=3344656 RepID=UPI0038B2B75D
MLSHLTATLDRPLPLAVPQAYTHKSNPGEVLLATWWQTGVDAYTITARWPASHGFYRDRHGLHDPLLLSETIRQTLPFLSHAAYEVPLGHQLLWQSFAWELTPTALRAEGSDAEIELRIVCPEVTYRKNRAASIAMEVEALRDGTLLGTARTRFTIQDPAVYRRLRGPYADMVAANARALLPARPMAPHRVGRESGRDVVLSPTDSTGCWELRADTGHPILFDHAVDHAPGMLLIEAVRQAAQAVNSPRPVVPVAMDLDFARYAELDAPCRFHAEPLAANVLRIRAEQNGALIFTADVTVADAPRH